MKKPSNNTQVSEEAGEFPHSPKKHLSLSLAALYSRLPYTLRYAHADKGFFGISYVRSPSMGHSVGLPYFPGLGWFWGLVPAFGPTLSVYLVLTLKDTARKSPSPQVQWEGHNGKGQGIVEPLDAGEQLGN
jgi:hypothetical protein